MKRQELEKEVVDALRGCRYCFPQMQMSGAIEYPKADEEEFSEFSRFICAVVHSQRRRAFFEGYKAGAGDMFMDIGAKDVEFDSQVAEHGAWDRWQEVDK